MKPHFTITLPYWLLGIGLSTLLSACVTINIYFPAAAAEKAADKIIDEVWQIKSGQPVSSAPSKDKPADTEPATTNSNK